MKKLSKWKERIITIAKEFPEYDKYLDLGNLLIIIFLEKDDKKLTLSFFINSEKYFDIRNYMIKTINEYYLI